ATAVPRRRSRVRTTTRRRGRLALVLVATAVIAAMLTILPLGSRDGGPTPAFAASLLRFANNSPLVLLRLPGWHVVYPDEQPGGYGEMHFVRGPANAEGNPQGAPLPHGAPRPLRASFHTEALAIGRVAQLTWSTATPPLRRYVAGGHERTATGL